MKRLAQFVVRRRRVVLVLAALAVPLFALVGGGVADRLTHGGFDDPGSESLAVADDLQERFGAGRFDFIVVVTAPDGDVDAPAVAAVGEDLAAALEGDEHVADVLGYWTAGRPPPLRGKDGTQAIIAARLDGDPEERVERAEVLADELRAVAGDVEVGFSGLSVVSGTASAQAEEDLKRSELLSGPFTFIALVVVFGGIVAALLPLSVALLTVLATFVALTLLTGFTDVSVFALNLTTGLGLGLAIDYSLFIVARYREELHAGHPVEVAIVRAMQTAGRTVVFSAGTVMVSMTALLLFPVTYLRSFGYAGMLVVPLAAFHAVVLLPALLAALGPKVDALQVIKRRPRTEGLGFWGRQAERVIAHPWPYIVAVTLVLVVLAIPFKDLSASRIDDRVLPTTNPARAATDQLRENFTLGESETINVVIDTEAPSDDQVSTLAMQLAKVEGVARVDARTGSYLADVSVPADDLSVQRFGAEGDTWLSVVPAVEPMSTDGEAVVHDVRAVIADTDGLEARVGGASAELVDTKEAVADVLPWAILLIAVATFVLLFMMTGSLLVPAKALLLNVLSLTATFGGMVWVFQQGNFEDLLGFTATGSLDMFTPVLMFCIAFGLSMDYEVFLLSRIKEEYDLERDNDRAIVVGLDRTGAVVTAAAVLLAIVFIAIATSQVTVVKMFGLGLTVAIVADAFLIRATLVPAMMTLAGRANWWAPKFLRRFHLRWGIWENEPIAAGERRTPPSS